MNTPSLKETENIKDSSEKQLTLFSCAAAVEYKVIRLYVTRENCGAFYALKLSLSVSHVNLRQKKMCSYSSASMTVYKKGDKSSHNNSGITCVSPI